MTKIFVSDVIDAAAPIVWQAVRGFGRIADWHPAITECALEDGGADDRIGTVRRLKLADGATLREQMLGLSDYDCFVQYTILEASLPVTDYFAELRCRPVTSGKQCYVEWWAEFTCPRASETELVDAISNGVFRKGLEALKIRLER